MSKYNDLGIDIGQVEQLAYTQLTHINGHTALWSVKEPEQEEGAATDNDDTSEVNVLHKRSYYGDAKFGPTQRSKYNERLFDVAAAFMFEGTVEDIPGSHMLSGHQVNAPETTMNSVELKSFRKRVKKQRRMPNQARALPNPAHKFVPSYRVAIHDGVDLSPALQMELNGDTADFDTHGRIVWTNSHKFKVDTFKSNDDMAFPPALHSYEAMDRSWRSPEVGPRTRSRSVGAYRPEHIEDVKRYGPATEDLQEFAINFITTELHRSGTQPYLPSDADIFRQTHLIMAVNAEVYPSLTEKNIVYLCNRMRFCLGWNISLRRLQKLLLREHCVFSVGSIPVVPAHLKAWELAEQGQIITLPSRKPNREDKEDWTEERKKAHNAAIRAQRKRLAVPKPNVYDTAPNAGKKKQEENTYVKLSMHEGPRERSYMRLRITFQYLDPSRPQDQPCHKADIDLTFRNTRPHGDVPGEDNVYTPTERILNVSDPSNISVLKKLFPHLTRDNPKYWEHCYGSIQLGNRLILLQFHHNELPSTSNLLTEKDNMPVAYDNLRQIVRRSPVIYLLVRGTDVDQIAQSMMNRFVELAIYNPLSSFYTDVSNPYITNTGIKDNDYMPKFVTLPENSFEVWDEAAARFGIGGLIELRFGMKKGVHHGKAAIHPVPHTQSSGLDVALFVNFSEEDANDETPKLTVGDSVSVDFGSSTDDTASRHAWKGKIVSPTLSTAIGQVCIVIHRPYKPDVGALDLNPRTTLSASTLDSMNLGALQDWTRNNCNEAITIFTKNDEKECKRLMNGLAHMQVPRKLLSIFRHKESILSQLRTMMMCNNHQDYDKSSLYGAVHDEDAEAFTALLPEILKDYQNVPVSQWRDGGLRANTAILGGISGSGKSYTSITALCGYLFRTLVNPVKRNMQLHELSSHLQDPTIAPPISEEEDDGDDDPQDTWGGDAWSGDTGTVWGDGADFGDSSGPATASDTEEGSASNTAASLDDDHAERAASDASDASDVSYDSDGASFYSCESHPAMSETPGVYENGRVTHCSIQNETVDHSYDAFVKILTIICAKLNIPMKLVVRCHSVQSESNAMIAMMDPNFELNAGGDPRQLRVNPTLKGDTNKSLLEHYLRHFRTQHPGISDKRFRAVEGSVAWIVLQLARCPGFDPTQVVIDTWSQDERDSIAEELRPIREAYNNISAVGTMLKETKKLLKTKFKLGFRRVISRAPVVCTTSSVANSSGFQMIRMAIAVCLEEAGRATDLEFIGFLSNYWNVDFRLYVGDQRQLGPQPYSSQKDNPFHAQMKTSTLARLNKTGFLFHELTFTSRFTNPELLGLCQQLNDVTHICEVFGAFDEQTEEKMKEINMQIWGLRNVIVVLNTQDVVPMRDATGSYYCINTALVTMHDLVHRLRHLSGSHVLIITPYNAQVRLLLSLQTAAISNASRAGNDRLAQQLSKVQVLTVDSAMGKDAHCVILDTVGHDGGFLFRQPRTIVAGTRARSSLIIVGPTYTYTSSTLIDPNNRLKEVLHRWGPKRTHIVTIPKHRVAKFEQYSHV